MSNRIVKLVRIITVLSLAGFFAHVTGAQDSPPASLNDQLNTQYKWSQVGVDSSGISITDAGVVLVVQKGGILGAPPTNVTPPITTYNVKDSQMHAAGLSRFAGGIGGAMSGRGLSGLSGKDTKLFTVGWKVYVLKIEVKLKDEKVVFTLMECDTCNNTNPPTNNKAQLAFQFPKGYLETADVSQVSDAIGQVLTADTSSGDAQQQQGAAPAGGGAAPDQAASAPAAAAPAPVPIQIGQTIDQVQANTSNALVLVADMGDKKIYKYNDLKVTFFKGKVTDVQ
jgi:hypothetical protein